MFPSVMDSKKGGNQIINREKVVIVLLCENKSFSNLVSMRHLNNQKSFIFFCSKD